MKHKHHFLILISFLLFLFSCKKKEEAAPLPSLTEYLQSQTDLSLFNTALDQAQLQLFKNGPGPFTWFAPTNAAFAAAGINADSINRMKPGDLSYIILYHMINTRFASNEMVAQNSFPRTTQMGAALYVGRRSTDFFINGATITSADNEVAGGLVHKINRILIPPALTGNLQVVLSRTGQHSLFIAALTRATGNRWTQFSTTSVFTILAPTDAAMNNAGLTSAVIATTTPAKLDSIVRYHYFNSTRLFTNDFVSNTQTPQTALGAGRTITALNNGNQLRGKNNTAPVNLTVKDIHATNGVVHIIDGVLNY
ncbi:MAG TPA: fasciclin domain-containing protein [Lacibacter sp.]|nr:fasciclin domain-containing protein [Lacibacter sp.]